MARARLLKAQFFTDEILAELPYAARIVFAGLWTLADREGRLEDRPKWIKLQTLPYDDENIDSLLSELASAGFIQRYTVEGKAFIQIRTFTKHQTPHMREPESTIPAPVKHSASTRQARKKPELAHQYTEAVPEAVPVPEAVAVSNVESPAAIATTHRIFEYWQSVMNHPTAKLTPKRSRKVRDRLAQGYTEADIRAAIDGCKASAFHQGLTENSDGRVYDDLELICRDGEHLEQFTNQNQQGETNGTLVRRNVSRRETRHERIERETREYFAALGADPLDSAITILPRTIGDGADRGGGTGSDLECVRPGQDS